MKRNFKIFAALADLHIGLNRITAASMKKQLKEHCIKVLEKLPYLDGIFILGDMLHTVVSLNSEYSQLYLWFVDQIYKIAKKKVQLLLSSKALLRMIMISYPILNHIQIMMMVLTSESMRRLKRPPSGVIIIS